MTIGPKIEHLTAYDVEQLLTVTILATGEKLPLLSIDGSNYTVLAIKDGHQVTFSIEECEGGQGRC